MVTDRIRQVQLTEMREGGLGTFTRMPSGWFLVKIYEGHATGWKIVSCSWLGNVWASPGKCWDLGWRRLDGKSGSGRKMNGNTSSIGRNASSSKSSSFFFLIISLKHEGND